FSTARQRAKNPTILTLEQGYRVFSALKGRERKAQGIALGGATEAKTTALKGRHRGSNPRPRQGRARHEPPTCRAPSGRAAQGASGGPGRCPGLSSLAPSGRNGTRQPC